MKKIALKFSGRLELATYGESASEMLGFAGRDMTMRTGKGEISNIWLLEFLGCNGGEVINFFEGRSPCPSSR